jgi:aspartate carbamoyltransferase catalytic subunit
MPAKTNDVAEAKRRQKERQKVREAAQRVAKAIGVPVVDRSKVEGYATGAVVIHPGVWLSLETAETLAKRLEG